MRLITYNPSKCFSTELKFFLCLLEENGQFDDSEVLVLYDRDGRIKDNFRLMKIFQQSGILDFN